MLSNYELPDGLKIEQHYNNNEGNINYNYRDNYDEECELYNEAIMMHAYNEPQPNNNKIKKKQTKKNQKKSKKRKSKKIIF
jgi:hypothetical protein